MSSVGVSIEVSGDGDASALHDAIWELVESWIEMYTAGTTYRAATSYLRDDAIPSALEDNTWGVEGTTLSYMFDSFGGKRSSMAGTWAHWMKLALASEWDRVVETAEQHELEISTDAPDLSALLSEGGARIAMRNDLWVADEKGLHTDTARIPVEELDAEERARYDVALTRCMCGPCTMLRPEPAFEQGILGTLSDEEGASSAAWYIARFQQASPETLLALIHAAGDETMRGAVEQFAAKVPTAAAVVAPLLPTLTGAPKARALYVLAFVELDDAQRAQLFEAVRSSLAGDDVAAEAAAEVSGLLRGVDPELYEDVARILDREVSEELRHQAVLGLSNAHFERPTSPTVRERLEREAKRETEAGQLASWFLKSFPIKR